MLRLYNDTLKSFIPSILQSLPTYLALTDHSGHSPENSLYALLAELARHPDCERLLVASRGNAANDAFFRANEGNRVYAVPVRTDFAFQPSGEQFSTGGEWVEIGDFDVIFLRVPRPVSTEWMNHLVKAAAGAIVINHPDGIERTSSKAYLLNFPEICPPIRLCHSVEEVLAFAEQFSLVLKPLKDYGGRGILKIDGDKLVADGKEHDTRAYLQRQEKYLKEEGYLAMKFLKNVDQGDKRILVVDGQIMAASLRLPPEGSWICNVAQGGKSVGTEVTKEEIAMIELIGPALKAEGILIFGADTLVNDDGKRVLSEVNTLSIGGFPQAQAQSGRPVVAQTIEKIVNYVATADNHAG